MLVVQDLHAALVQVVRELALDTIDPQVHLDLHSGSRRNGREFCGYGLTGSARPRGEDEQADNGHHRDNTPKRFLG